MRGLRPAHGFSDRRSQSSGFTPRARPFAAPAAYGTVCGFPSTEEIPGSTVRFWRRAGNRGPAAVIRRASSSFSKGGSTMFSRSFRTSLAAGPALLGVAAFALAGPCTGPGAPTTTETKCLTAVQIPGAPLRSYDISWVNPHRAEYYLADRSNASIDIIDTRHVTFKRFLGKGQFVGVKLNGAGTAVNNDISGPDGVVTHGRWLYAGDGDSTLKVFDLDAPDSSALKQTISTGGQARVDEMALTTDGEMLLVANNADTPPFGTLFA